MLEPEKGTLIKAKFYRSQKMWRVDLHEIIYGQTKFEVELTASYKLRGYRESDKLITELQAELDKTRESLKIYGRHVHCDCNAVLVESKGKGKGWYPKECSCGLEQALKAGQEGGG